MKKVVLVGFAVILLTSGTALGWGLFNDGADNYCAQCHIGSVIMGAHGSVACLACHVETSGDVPATSNCAMCHAAGGMVTLHNGGGITSCGVCHADLPNELRDWSEIKSLYQE